MEKAFDFRNRLQQIHQTDRLDQEAASQIDGTWIDSSWQLVLPAESSQFLLNAAKDLVAYFKESFGLTLAQPRRINPAEKAALLAGKPAARHIYIQSSGEKNQGEAAYTYRIRTGLAIQITASCPKAAAKACFRLEELMNLNQGPVLAEDNIQESILFSPRIVFTTMNDGYYPDNYLALIAHYGFDAICIGTGAVLEDKERRAAVQDLISRAAAWGIDAYTVNPFKNEMHPTEAGALAYYQGRQGELFRLLPDLKGIFFIGESCEFPSRDPRTTGRPWRESLQDEKPSPGWFPCNDFPQFMQMMCQVIHQARPDADVVLWTYNWGFEDEKLRLELIKNLPPECVLMATFEMFEKFQITENIIEVCTDYTLYFPGPGRYYSSEAELARARGLKLFSMTNTAGNTWDIGCAQLLPAPYQWQKRWQAVRQSHFEHGLSGIMETLSYGFFPSFLPELALAVFRQPAVDFDQLLRQIAVRDFSQETADQVLAAFSLYSQAMTHCIPTNEDQYGPCRIGPAYPLFFERHEPIPRHSSSKRHPNGICNPVYRYNLDLVDKLLYETDEYEKMARLFAAGSLILAECIKVIPAGKRPAARRLLGIARFIERTARTTVHVKRWHLLKGQLGIYVDTEPIWVGGRKNMPDAQSAQKPLQPSPEPASILLEMIDLAEAEIANAQQTYQLVENDSRLGFEAEFDYGCSTEQLDWKIQVTRRAVQEEILPRLRAVLGDES